MPACHVTVPGRLGGQVLCMLLITKAMDPPPPDIVNQAPVTGDTQADYRMPNESL